MMGSEKFDRGATDRHGIRAAVRFGSTAEADRRIAGLAAAARIVRELAEAGVAHVRLIVPGAGLAAATAADIARIAPDIEVRTTGEAVPGAPGAELDLSGRHLVFAPAVRALIAGRTGRLTLHGETIAAFDPAGPAEEAVPGQVLPLDPPREAAASILRSTGKESDGLVSRRLNRPISRQISGLLLHVGWLRPTHLTIVCALLGVVMIAALFLGGPAGFVVAAFLLQTASILDGVDGEMARATFRTTALGATLDTAVDMATNLLFVLGLTVNLALYTSWHFAYVGGIAFSELALGLLVIFLLARRRGGPLSFDLMKRHYSERYGEGGPAEITRVITIATSRDFLALLFLVLTIVNLEEAIPYIGATIATVWFFFVLLALPELWPRSRWGVPEQEF
jgi:CDP-L-myo-inositol myo-inositolphosphotransferase